MKFRAASILILAVAALLRIPDLTHRPMHADEDILARKLGTLLETGSWKYEPGEYHGPLLHYVTAGVAYVAGARGYRDLTETMLRIVPAVLGVALVAMPLLFAGRLGRATALGVAALTAISPAMVYYSRYFIPEMLLVALTAATAAAGPWWVAGLALGLMFATKETAVIAGLALLIAAWRRPDWRAIAIAVGVAVILLGPRELIETVLAYARQAVSRHVNPWHFYLVIVLRQETLIAALAVAGAAAAITGKGLEERERTLARFAAVYALAMFIVYSAIPYKTPWCVLGPLHGMIVLGGLGGVALMRLARPALVIVVLGAAYLGYQAYVDSWPRSADPRNPYAYAHTTRDVYTIRERLRAFQDLVPIQVISSQNIWPLPWYLRAFPNVEWRRTVTADLKPAPVILATPDVEDALLHHLYEVLPPGGRPLYVPLFDNRMDLRPGFELRGYVQQSVR